MTYFFKFCKKYGLILPPLHKKQKYTSSLVNTFKVQTTVILQPCSYFQKILATNLLKSIRELCGNVFQIKYNTLTKWFLHLYCIFNINDIKKVIKRTKMLLFKIFNNFWWRWKEFFVMSREIIQNIIFIFDLP